jgi:hypothetical protein
MDGISLSCDNDQLVAISTENPSKFHPIINNEENRMKIEKE